MEITPVRVGGANALDPITNLPMYRQFTTFEGNIKDEFIRVYFIQWVESNGVRLNEISGSYIVMDHPEEGHIIPGDPNANPPIGDTYVVDRPYAPMFTYGWLNRLIPQQFVGLKFGVDIIIGAINQTLGLIPYNVTYPYYTRP